LLAPLRWSERKCFSVPTNRQTSTDTAPEPRLDAPRRSRRAPFLRQTDAPRVRHQLPRGVSRVSSPTSEKRSARRQGLAGAARSVLPVIRRLLWASGAQGLRQPLRTWHLLRLLTSQNSGRADRSAAVQFLITSHGYTRPTISRHLTLGEGVLWRTSAHGRLYLRGPVSLARLWGLDRLDGFVVLAPISAAHSVAEWNALAYHIAHPSQPPLRLTKKGKLTPGRSNHPISRASLQDRTGIPERTQRHYGIQTNEKGEPLTITAPNYSTERKLSRDRQSMVLRRLGNTCTRTLPTRGWGQGKAFNESASGGASAKASPSCNGSRARRRYFESPKALIRARERRGRVYPEAFLRFPRSQHRRVGIDFPAPAIAWWEPCPAPQRELI